MSETSTCRKYHGPVFAQGTMNIKLSFYSTLCSVTAVFNKSDMRKVIVKLSLAVAVGLGPVMCHTCNKDK